MRAAVGSTVTLAMLTQNSRVELTADGIHPMRDGIHAIADGINPMAHGMSLGLRTMNTIAHGMNAIAHGMNLGLRTMNPIRGWDESRLEDSESYPRAYSRQTKRAALASGPGVNSFDAD
jgi:hypothetical protein